MKELRPVDAGAGAKTVTAVDLVAMIWRERALGVVVGGAVLALGVAVALLQPKTYRAETHVLVRLGQEYVFQPRVGGAGAGAAPRSEEMINAELKLFESPEVVRRAIARVGVARLFPDLARELRGDKLNAQAEIAFARALEVWTSPNTPIIAARFTHEDPSVAAETLNATVDEYLAYRNGVLVAPAAATFDTQSRDFEERTAEAASALQIFLWRNGIADFDGEQKALVDLAARLELDVAEAEAKRREMEGRAASLRARIGRQAETVDLYVETDAAKRLIELRMEREQMLARFKPDADPVRDIDRRIAQVERYLTEEKQPALTRRGPNPVRQAIEGELYGAEADARAQGAREAALRATKAETARRLDFLRTLEPTYRRLEREHLVLSENAKAFDSRAEEARALQALAGGATDAVRQIEPARAPTKGSSLRMEIALLSLFAATVLAVGAALLRGFARESFPTPSSAARALDERILGVATRSAA